jgi:hypothetical protein
MDNLLLRLIQQFDHTSIVQFGQKFLKIIPKKQSNFRLILK